MISPKSSAENPGYKTKRKGVRRPRWRNGYVEEWCPARARYIYQHRLVMERHLGRVLLRSEVVHHKNHDKTDNRLSNLKLYASRAEHIAEHAAEGTWGGRGVPRPSLLKPLAPCPVCGELFKSKRTRGSDTKTCSQSCGQTLRYAVKPSAFPR